VFIENILLSNFLGMCSFLAVSKRVDSSMGLGLAVTFICTLTCAMNWAVQEYLLAPGALAWAGMPDIDLSFLGFITFISTIAAATQLIEMAVEKMSPKLYAALGIFLPLIAVNCAVLGATLFMVERHYTFAQATVFGFGSGIGWWMAIVCMAAIREKLKYARLPPGLEGLGITMLMTGLMAMGFMCFAGINLKKEEDAGVSAEARLPVDTRTAELDTPTSPKDPEDARQLSVAGGG
jgi:Na+-transporting NADH:ubiquinone oxidoreductase subunit E